MAGELPRYSSGQFSKCLQLMRLRLFCASEPASATQRTMISWQIRGSANAWVMRDYCHGLLMGHMPIWLPNFSLGATWLRFSPNRDGNPATEYSQTMKFGNDYKLLWVCGRGREELAIFPAP